MWFYALLTYRVHVEKPADSLIEGFDWLCRLVKPVSFPRKILSYYLNMLLLLLFSFWTPVILILAFPMEIDGSDRVSLLFKTHSSSLPSESFLYFYPQAHWFSLLDDLPYFQHIPMHPSSHLLSSLVPQCVLEFFNFLEFQSLLFIYFIPEAIVLTFWGFNEFCSSLNFFIITI